MHRKTIFTALAALSILLSSAVAPAFAEVTELKVVRQFGISFLPLLVMQDKKLFEKHAKAEGLDTQATYMQVSGGNTVNDALLSGTIHIASGGIPPMAIIWARTQGSGNEIKAIAAKNSAPILLLTRDPAIKSIRDFTDKDRIAMPAAKSQAPRSSCRWRRRRCSAKAPSTSTTIFTSRCRRRTQPLHCCQAAAKSTITFPSRRSSIRH